MSSFPSLWFSWYYWDGMRLILPVRPAKRVMTESNLDWICLVEFPLPIRLKTITRPRQISMTPLQNWKNVQKATAPSMRYIR